MWISRLANRHVLVQPSGRAPAPACFEYGLDSPIRGRHLATGTNDLATRDQQKRREEHARRHEVGMPYNGVADNLQTSPARPLREGQILRQMRKAALSVRILERNLRGGVRSKLVKLSVRFSGLLYGVDARHSSGKSGVSDRVAEERT